MHDQHWPKEGYQESALLGQHRPYLMATILTIMEDVMESATASRAVLELGCGGGVNLYLLSFLLPQYVSLFGVDISSRAVAEANHWLMTPDTSRNKDINVYRADVRALSNLRGILTNGFDVVFSDATLIYIKPGEIRTVLSGLIKLTNRTLIMSEWHDPNAEKSFTFNGHWVHNFTNLLPGAITFQYPEGSWEDEGWNKYGHIVAFNV